MVTAIPTGAPVLIDSNLIANKWTWKVQMPLLVTYQNSNSRTTQNLFAEGTVINQGNLNDKNRLVIDDIILK